MDEIKNLYENAEDLGNGRYRFHESVTLDPSSYKRLPLNESNNSVLIEGKSVPCRGAYTFRVWEVNAKNLNGRTYTEALCNKVISDNKVTVGLADHPVQEGSTKSIYAVEKNPRISEGWLVVDTFLVGDHGQLINEVLQAGGPVGVSSSALGQLDEKTGEVMLEGFELERYHDNVLNPSNNYSNTLTSSTIAQESTTTNFNLSYSDGTSTYSSNGNYSNNEIDSSLNEESINNKQNFEEKITMDKTQKLHEKNLTLNIKGLLKEAVKESDVQMRLGLLEEILDNFDEDFVNEALENQVKESIDVTKKEISELAEKGKTVESLNEKVETSEKSIKELEEKIAEQDKTIETLKEATEEAKSRYQKIKKIHESTKGQGNDEKVTILERERDDLTKMVIDLKEEVEKLKVKEPKVDEETKSEDVVTEEKVDETATDEKVEEVSNDGTKAESEVVEESVEDVKARRDALQEKVIQRYGGARYTEVEKIRQYYESLIEKTPEIEEIEEAILSSKTVSDAQAHILRFREKVSAQASLTRKIEEAKDADKPVDRIVEAKRELKMTKGLW